MAAKIRRSNELLPLSPPVLYILLAVADEARHGYAIMQEVERQTDGAVRLLPGSLYSTIKRMLNQGLIVGDAAPRRQSEDPRRRYYGITDVGRDVARSEIARMQALVSFAVVRGLVSTRDVDA